MLYIRVALSDTAEMGAAYASTVSSATVESASQSADHLSVHAVVCGNRVFHLRKTLTLHFQIDRGLCVCEFEPLGILSHGKTAQEAFDAFQAEFAACWDGIVQEDDARLTGDARLLKKQLLKHVVNVQPLS